MNGENESDAGGFLNPSYRWRVALVALFWVVPGTMVGPMVSFFLPFDPNVCSAVCAVAGGVIGALLEAEA
jgi:hypothetical protein